MQTFSPTDYKRWLYYSVTFKDQSQKEELIRCLDKEENTISCSIRKTWSEQDQLQFTVKCDFAKEELVLIGEDMKSEFISYFRKHHIENGSSADPSNYLMEEHAEKDQSSFLKSHPESNEDNEYKPVNPHRKEQRYYHFSLFISISIYAVLFGGIIVYLFTEPSTAYMSLFAIGIIAFFIFALGRLARGFVIGLIKGNAIKVTEEQYPEIFEMVKDQAGKLGFKKLPEIFIYYGNFNAFVTRMAGRNYLVLMSEVVETSLNGDSDILKFVIGHEMGHIKRKHLSKSLLLFPSKFIPFLPLAYSRACEFTCDRIGYSFSPNGAVNGMLTMSIGKELIKKVDPQKFVENVVEENSFWVWFSEKFSTHPHVVKRLEAIKKYNQFR